MSDVPRWRRIVGSILLIVGCVLIPVSLSAVWVRNTLLDTDNYVSTVGRSRRTRRSNKRWPTG